MVIVRDGILTSTHCFNDLYEKRFYIKRHSKNMLSFGMGYHESYITNGQFHHGEITIVHSCGNSIIDIWENLNGLRSHKYGCKNNIVNRKLYNEKRYNDVCVEWGCKIYDKHMYLYEIYPFSSYSPLYNNQLL